MSSIREKLVIFDLDGTIFETSVTVTEAVGRAAEEMGLKVPEAKAIEALIGETSEDFCKCLAPNLDDEGLRQFDEKVSQYEREAVARKGQMFEGTRRMLEHVVAAGFTPAICSNGSREYIERVLYSCEITKLFKYIEGWEPDRSKSEAVKRILDLSHPTFAVMVGDRSQDFEAARQNRLVSIGVRYGYGGEEVEQADLRAESPDEVLSHILRCDIFGHVEREIMTSMDDRAFVIGVNGVDTSGKTLFARQLSKFLEATGYRTQIIHLDDFHNNRELRSEGYDEIDAYIRNAFAVNRLVNDLLEPARKGEHIDCDLKLLDLDSDTFTNIKHYHIGQMTIVIVEGVLLYRDPLDKYFDYRIFLDTDFSEVLRRAEERDVPRYGRKFLDRYIRKYIPIQRWYIDNYEPDERSNLVIDNNDYRRPRIRQDAGISIPDL